MIRSCVGLSSFKALGGLAVVLLAVPSFGAVITFDDIPAETEYVKGDVITSNGINITVTGEGSFPRVPPFEPASIDGKPIVARTAPSSIFGETIGGNAFIFEDDTLAKFELPGVLDGFSLQFGRVFWLSINGERETVFFTPEVFEIGGVRIQPVIQDDIAILIGVGEIHSFEIQSIGGGMSVDNVILSQPIPEPGSLGLLFVGGGLWVRRRRS